MQLISCVEQTYIIGGATCNCLNSGECGEVMAGPIYTVVTKQECYLACCVRALKFRWWAWTTQHLHERDRVQGKCSDGFPEEVL